MCSALTKIRGDTVLQLVGIPCCLRVEAVEQYAPEISRANGWAEMTIGWTEPGMSLARIALPDDVVAKIRGLRPIGTLTYRERTVHFLDRRRIVATRDYIASILRRAADFPRDREFLENLPAEFLKASARKQVVKRLDQLLEVAGIPRS